MKMENIDFKKVKSKVEKVHIRGLKITRDDYVKYQFDDIFEATNFDDMLNKANELEAKLAKMGCFKSIETFVDAAQNNDPNSYEIIYNVEELKTIGGAVHTGVGNNEGYLSSSVYFPNLFGKGQRISGEYSYGTRNHTDYRITYSSPRGLNPNKQFSTSLFRRSNDYSWSKYSEIESGLSFDFTTPYQFTLRDRHIFKGTNILTYEGSWRQLISSFDSAFDIREQSGHTLKSSVKYTNLIDLRDSNTLPTKGGYLKTIFELAGLGGDVKYFKYNSDYQYSRTFFKYFTTQLTFSKGFMVPLKDEKKILINDRFFLGGPLSLRGFSNRGAGPHKDDCAVGNDAYWLLGAHLYTPLPFLHKNKAVNSFVKTHSFLNIGNILSFQHLKSLEENRLEYLLTNFRLSIGTGLVLSFGNIARLELNYAWPLIKCDGDKHVEGLQFGVGIVFN